jgi:hypothetical protein
VLVERGNGLLVAVFEQVEAAAIETVDGIAAVGDHHIDQDEVGVGAENSGGRRWRSGR